MPKYLLIPALVMVLASCGRDEASDNRQMPENQGTITSQKDIVFSDVRARTGSEGGMGAVYFTLANNSRIPDTLRSIESGVAQLAEIHESFEKGDGTVGMRKIPYVALDVGERVQFAPGGYHVMLIRLKEALTPGDTVNLEVRFDQSGAHNLAVPVVQDP